MNLKYREADYINFDPCEGDRDARIECRTVQLVKARKSHLCFLGSHPLGDHHLIQAGDMYRHEKALVDGGYWGTYRVCMPCMDKWLGECGRPPAAPAEPSVIPGFHCSDEMLSERNHALVK